MWHNPVNIICRLVTQRIGSYWQGRQEQEWVGLSFKLVGERGSMKRALLQLDK